MLIDYRITYDLIVYTFSSNFIKISSIDIEQISFYVSGCDPQKPLTVRVSGKNIGGNFVCKSQCNSKTIR